MIRINLLPEEYRRSEGTSPKVFAAVVGTVVLVCCALGWFGYVYFGEYGKLQLEHAEASERYQGLQKQVAYHDALAAEKKDFERRDKTIQDIADSRVLWTQFLDQMIDAVNNDGDFERHVAWFTRIGVKDVGKSGGPSVKMPGAVQGGAVDRLAHFHEDIELTPFYPNVARKNNPSGKVDEDKDKTPPESYTFQLELDFKPAAQWVGPAEPAPAAGN